MKKTGKKVLSIYLAFLIIISMITPAFIVSYAAESSINITDENGVEITERQTIKEYDTVQLKYTTAETVPDDAYVVWSSNLPLLAGVDENGVVKGYDYSKSAVINLWIDENIRVLPLVGDAMADQILESLSNTGVDLDDMNNELIVAIIRGVAGDALANSLETVLNNMNVKITATLCDVNGNELSSDTVEFVVEKNLVASVLPTGVHITNKNVVPLDVAVGKTVQLFAAVTPVRLHHNVKWSVGKNTFDLESKKHAEVTADGLVTFTSPGTASILVQDASNLAFSSYITFNVYDPADLPVESFDIVGNTTVKEGETTQLAIANVVPAGAYTGDLVWSVENSSIAVIDQNGIVTGLDGGDGYIEYSKTTQVTAVAGGVTKTVDLKVTRVGVTGNISAVEIAGPDAIPVGSVTQYKSNVTPARLNENKSLYREWGLINRLTGETLWATDENPVTDNFISIDSNGNVTALASGQVTLVTKATLNNQTLETKKDLIVGKAIEDFDITGKLSVAEGDEVQLSISNILPEDYDPEILATAVWSVADPKVASVTQNGLVKGLDCGGSWAWSTQSTDVTVSVGGISKTVTVKVTNKVGLDKYTGGQIIGSDYVIKDFPMEYSAIHSPERVNATRQFWGVVTDDGAAPWNASSNMGIASFKGNMENSIVKVDAPTDGNNAETGKIIGLQAGTTTIHTYIANLLTTYIDFQKEITVVEIEPKSIKITPPKNTDYVEGSVDLDLTGMVIELTYSRDDIAEYYGEEFANNLTDDQLTVPVTDFTVGKVNENALDTEQYVLVSVTRAGKSFKTVFPITIHSKELTSIELENPQYEYLEGVTNLNLSDLRVKANYNNAESEYITDYVVNESEFNPELFDEEQNITVTYTHARRSASAAFPVIVYGIPVVSVDSGSYNGGWTDKDITFTLSSTHQLDGVKYYYKTDSDSQLVEIDGNTLTVNSNTSDVYYFKAINSSNIESEFTQGFEVKRDDITPSFKLEQTVKDVTNKDYAVSINDLIIGASGIKSVTLNGSDITDTPTQFTVSENGTYDVVIIANNGHSSTQSITVENIDKEAPTVNSISISHKENGGFARFLNKLTFKKFFNEKVEITIDTSDKGVSGIDKIEYRLLDENGNPINDWKTYNESDKPTQDSEFKGFVEARAIDKATNESDILRSDGYVIDRENPTDVIMNATYNGESYTPATWVAGDVHVQLSSTAFSDIYEYCYRIDGGEWISLDSDAFTATKEGMHKYEFKAISYSNLESAVSEIDIRIDRQTPVIRVDFEGTFGRWSGDGVKFKLSTEEESLSGVSYYYNNGNDWVKITTGEEIEINYSVNATFRFKAVNNAGTESYPSDSYIVMIDAEEPTITLNQSVTTSTTKPYNIEIQTTAGEAGLKSVFVNGIDITNESELEVSKNGTYVFTAVGNNGKITTKTLEITNFLTPVLEVTNIDFGDYARHLDHDFGYYYSSQPEITVSTNNTGASPISKIEYRLFDDKGIAISDWLEYNSDSKPKMPNEFKGYAEARVIDTENNVSLVKRSVGITVDAIPPTAPAVTTVNNGSEYNGEWVSGDITFNVNSTAFSEIFEYLYRIDGGQWQKMTANSLTVNSNGEHNYEFKAVSNSALESTISSSDVKIENVPPALQIAVKGTIGHVTNEDVVFTLSAPNVLSGVKYYYSIGADWIPLDSDTLTVSENGTAVYKFKAVNTAGVESYVSPDYSVMIDKSIDSDNRVPSIMIIPSGTIGSYTDKPVTFTLFAENCKDGETFYYNDGSGFKELDGNILILDSNTNADFTFKVKDGTGRESSVSPAFKVLIDMKEPDVDALAAAIEKFNEIDPADYSETSYNNLKNVVDDNKSLLDTVQSQEEVDQAVIEILEAIYDLEPYLNFTVSAENGSYEVTCDGSTSSDNKYSLLFGTEITLSAAADDGYEFVGWYDVINNRYFSKESTYTFKITSNINLKAVFAKKQSATLTFATYSNWVQSTVTKTVDEWNGITSIDDILPEVPYRYGYSNGRWVYDNNEVLTKLRAGESVILIPEYDEDDTSLPTPREPEDGVPALDLYYKLDADSNVGSFVMAAGIPDDCQIESVGVAFYYKKANEFDPTKFELLNNNKMLVSRFNTDEIEDIYIVNINKFTSTYNWAARGFVTYYDAEGNLKTAYSNQVNIVNREQV